MRSPTAQMQAQEGLAIVQHGHKSPEVLEGGGGGGGGEEASIWAEGWELCDWRMPMEEVALWEVIRARTTEYSRILDEREKTASLARSLGAELEKLGSEASELEQWHSRRMQAWGMLREGSEGHIQALQVESARGAQQLAMEANAWDDVRAGLMQAKRAQEQKRAQLQAQTNFALKLAEKWNLSTEAQRVERENARKDLQYLLDASREAFGSGLWQASAEERETLSRAQRVSEKLLETIAHKQSVSEDLRHQLANQRQANAAALHDCLHGTLRSPDVKSQLNEIVETFQLLEKSCAQLWEVRIERARVELLRSKRAKENTNLRYSLS